jgi:hypothetical protein
MARQAGRVQLEQSNMRLALHMAEMAKGRCSQAAVEEPEYLINNPRAEVQEVMKQGSEVPGHREVNAAVVRHLTMHWHNQVD